MQTPVTIPSVGGSPAEIYLAEWLFAVGDDVRAGEPLVLIEADKAQVEVCAPVSGRLVRIDAGPDELLSIDQVVAIIESG
jgi:pyruvate dehydrogenase E2 component (dihydrolipoamide acetyltransferase)